MLAKIRSTNHILALAAVPHLLTGSSVTAWIRLLCFSTANVDIVPASFLILIGRRERNDTDELSFRLTVHHFPASLLCSLCVCWWSPEAHAHMCCHGYIVVYFKVPYMGRFSNRILNSSWTAGGFISSFGFELMPNLLTSLQPQNTVWSVCVLDDKQVGFQPTVWSSAFSPAQNNWTNEENGSEIVENIFMDFCVLEFPKS